jgi:valyl-tRNA synthetase
MTEIPKNYEIKSVEKKWIKFWEENKFYHAKVRPDRKKYSIVIPPPNVTGILHIGHILNNTIQDIYARWKRMQGYEVCWVPGMDHAGISTQMMVERDLENKGIKRQDIGRDKFIELVWQWKEKHGGHILKQLKTLGASLDWSKERFTMDESLSNAVKEVFVDLYKKGLIYKGERIINWDPKSQTAVSDDEVFYKEKSDKLYYIKYFLKDSDKFITIATTRPETMFGDTAVAVNPNDDRFKDFIGKRVILPLVGKEIPVIADDYVDIEFGTGALKITPAHDINDFEVGKRHNLESINVINKDSTLNKHALDFEGQDIFKARKIIAEKLEQLGHLEKVEELVHNVAFSEKSKAMIEPLLSEQWFVAMKKLAEPAIKVVEEGKIKFHPELWTKTYFHWMRNVKDWCISRQLWWGHQIPVWYHNETGEIYCDTKPPADPENWTQDPDVLDTWFSSWLWPFSVFGWENSEKDQENKELNYFYPTDLLVTGADIIYLWVARMIMSGLEYMKDIPFKDVYFNSIIRDGQGRKMSKTLGNSPDPLDVMDKYGTDALRFTLVYLAPLGNDVLYEEKKTEIGRNFITKLWNAGRFLMMNYTRIHSSNEYGNDDVQDDIVEKWIDSRFYSTLKDIEQNLNSYRLNDYTKAMYSFVWSDFCDWYIELLKIKLEEDKSSAKKTIARAMERYEKILKLLHPVIPFVTEELWHLIKEGTDTKTISTQEFPESMNNKIDPLIEDEFEQIKNIVTSIRNLRSENNIVFTVKCKVAITTSQENLKLLDHYSTWIQNLCNVELEYSTDISEPDNSISNVISGFEIYLLLEGIVDVEKQKAKFLKEIENLEKYLKGIDSKLSNQKFIDNAPPELVAAEKDKKKDTEDKLDKLRSKVS